MIGAKPVLSIQKLVGRSESWKALKILRNWEVRRWSWEFLENAVNAKDLDIHVINAQTALGKTEQYAEIVKNQTDKKFLIAASTIKLQHELAERIEAKGVKCEITESIYTKATQLPFPGLKEELDWAFS